MSFAVYTALVSGVASHASPSFPQSSAPPATSTNRTVGTQPVIASTHVYYRHDARDNASAHRIRITIPTPNAATSALDVPHLLPAVMQHQRQAHLPVCAPVAIGGRRRDDGEARDAAHRHTLSAARRSAAVAVAYQQALSSTSSTTAAMLAFGLSRHRTAVASPSDGRAGAATCDRYQVPTPGSASRTSLLPSGGAPLQSRRCVVSGTPRSDASPSVRGQTVLRPPQWSTSPSAEAASADRVRTNPTSMDGEDGDGGVPLCWESPQRTTASGLVTRSPSSLRFSDSLRRAWSPPSYGDAHGGEAGLLPRHRACPQVPQGDSPPLTDVARPASTRVDVTQPFLSSLHVPAVAPTTQPPSPTQAARSVHDWTRTRDGDLDAVVVASSWATEDGLQVRLSGTPSVAGQTPLARVRGGVAPWLVDEEACVCLAEEEEEEEKEGQQQQHQGDEEEEKERDPWRTPSSSAQRPRPSAQLLAAAAAHHRHPRHRAKKLSPPQLERSVRRSSGTRALPLPAFDSDKSPVTRAGESRRYHAGRSHSVAAAAAASAAAPGTGEMPADVRQRILAKQRALEAMLAEENHDNDGDRMDAPTHNEDDDVDEFAAMMRSVVPPSCPRKSGVARESSGAAIGETVTPRARSASWALRSLTSPSSSSQAALLEAAAAADAVPWRPTVNYAPTSTLATTPRRHPRHVPSSQPPPPPPPTFDSPELSRVGQSWHPHRHGHVTPSPVNDHDTVKADRTVDASHEEEEETEGSMEPVGMDEAGEVIYRRVPRRGLSRQPSSSSSSCRDVSDGPHTFVPMEKALAEHGLGIPCAVPTTESPRSPSQSSVLLSPDSLFRALARAETRPHADAPGVEVNAAAMHRAAKAQRVDQAEAADEGEDFTIRRSTVHNVLTHLLAADAGAAGGVVRAPLGGAPLRYQLPASMSTRGLPLPPPPSTTPTAITGHADEDAGFAEEEDGRASSFLHIRPSTRDPLPAFRTATTLTVSREGSPADPIHARPSDSGSDFIQRGSLALSAIEAATSASRASLLSSASFDYFAARFGGGGGSGGSASSAVGSRPRHSWAPRKIAPRVTVSDMESSASVVRPSTSAMAFPAACVAGELRYSSSGSSVGRVSAGAEPLPEPAARTEAFMAAANELAETLRAYSDRQQQVAAVAAAAAATRPCGALESFTAMGMPQPVFSPSSSSLSPQRRLRRAGSLTSHVDPALAVTHAVAADRASRSPSLRSPSWPRGSLGTGVAGVAHTARAAATHSESLTTAMTPSMSPIPHVRSPHHHHHQARCASFASTPSPPVVSFDLPEHEDVVAAAVTGASSPVSGSAAGKDAEDVLLSPGVPPWISRLLRVQYQLQHLRHAVLDDEEGLDRAVTDANGNDDDDDDQGTCAARAFEGAYRNSGRPAQPSPDAVPGERRAGSSTLAASWWSNSAREAASQSLRLASTSGSRAHSQHTPSSSTAASSIVAGRRAILLDLSLAGTLTTSEHEAGEDGESVDAALRSLSASLWGHSSSTSKRASSGDANPTVMPSAMTMTGDEADGLGAVDPYGAASPPLQERTLMMVDAIASTAPGQRRCGGGGGGAAEIHSPLADALHCPVYTRGDCTPKENEAPAAVAAAGRSPCPTERACPTRGGSSVPSTRGSGLQDGRISLNPLL